MRVYFSIFLAIILGQKSYAILPKDVSDEVYNTDPLPTESDISSNEDLRLWGVGTESDFRHIPIRLNEVQLDQDPFSSSSFTANSDFSSCQNNIRRDKIHRRVSELCPADSADPPPKEANIDVPDILDDKPMEKAFLENSMPALDLSSSRPMCTHKKFITHVCCDGPTGPWQPGGFFATVEKCWPCSSVQI